MSHQRHKEVVTKVNAWVDEGIVELVDALNEFENVITVDSCQGADEGAYVYFRCQTEDETTSFVKDLCLALRAELRSTDSYILRIEWIGTEEPLAQIITSCDYLSTLQEALAAIRPRLAVTGRAQNFTV